MGKYKFSLASESSLSLFAAAENSSLISTEKSCYILCLPTGLPLWLNFFGLSICMCYFILCTTAVNIVVWFGLNLMVLVSVWTFLLHLHHPLSFRVSSPLLLFTLTLVFSLSYTQSLFSANITIFAEQNCKALHKKAQVFAVKLSLLLLLLPSPTTTHHRSFLWAYYCASEWKRERQSI